MEQVSSASAGAGTFYNWVGQILSNFNTIPIASKLHVYLSILHAFL